MIIKLPFCTESYCSGPFGAVREQLRTALESYSLRDSDDVETILDIAEREYDFDSIAADCVSKSVGECLDFLIIELRNVTPRAGRGVYADISENTMADIEEALKGYENGAKCLKAEQNRLANCYSVPEGAELNAAPLTAAFNFVREYVSGCFLPYLEEWGEVLDLAIRQAICAYRSAA